MVSGLVKSGRKLEMQFFENIGVFAQILHRDEVKKKSGKSNLTIKPSSREKRRGF